MEDFLWVILVLAAFDLLGGGLLLALLWVQHRRIRNVLRQNGATDLPSATKDFVFLGALVFGGFMMLCFGAWLIYGG